MAVRVIFMGTPEFAVPALNALLAASDVEVVGVVTQPDRPAGRGNVLQPSPVKVAAQAANLPILQPQKLRAAGVLDQLQQLAPDLIVVAAYGQILRQNVLDLPKYGCINVHASLLPRWRGAAPIQAAIKAGDAETGITIMKMDAGLDTGPMLLKQAVPIAADETGGTLHDKLAALGGSLLIAALRPYIAGRLVPQAQDDAHATYAPMLKKEDEQINWSLSAAEIARTVRAYTPRPGTFTLWQGQVLKITSGGASDAVTVMGDQHAVIGEVVRLSDGRVGIGTGQGLYLPQLLQLPGKSALPVRDFLNGRAHFIGAVLGTDTAS